MNADKRSLASLIILGRLHTQIYAVVDANKRVIGVPDITFGEAETIEITA